VHPTTFTSASPGQVRKETAVEGSSGAGAIVEYCRNRGLVAPASLVAAHAQPSSELRNLLYRPSLDPSRPPSLEWACQIIDACPWPLLRNLIPLLPVDEQSFACVVASPEEALGLPGEGAVVRWHLGVHRPEHQATLVHISTDLYVRSVAEELRARPVGLSRILDEIGPTYKESHLKHGRRPRDYVVRPVRLACQNVIVGLAALRGTARCHA
jgi:hypothetical protein